VPRAAISTKRGAVRAIRAAASANSACAASSYASTAGCSATSAAISAPGVVLSAAAALIGSIGLYQSPCQERSADQTGAPAERRELDHRRLAPEDEFRKLLLDRLEQRLARLAESACEHDQSWVE